MKSHNTHRETNRKKSNRRNNVEEKKTLKAISNLCKHTRKEKKGHGVSLMHQDRGKPTKTLSFLVTSGGLVLLEDWECIS